MGKRFIYRLFRIFVDIGMNDNQCRTAETNRSIYAYILMARNYVLLRQK